MSTTAGLAHRSRAALTALLMALAARSAATQSAAWSVRASPAADLWFHGLAVVGFGGFGDLPLYAPGYASRVARDRATQGGQPSLLLTRADRLGEAFTEDSAFEVLHFVPLYFEHSERDRMLDALARVAREGGAAVSQVGAAERFGSAAIAAALPTQAERRVLGEFVAALQDEWDRYYRAAAGRLQAGEDVAGLTRLEARWSPLARALTPYLERAGLAGGTLLLSSAIGPDGRLFEGDPRSASHNVLAVHAAAGAEAADVPFLVVRELSYPVVRRALTALPGLESDRVEAERLSGVVAVRCGARLLARYAPEEQASYQAAWLRISGRPGPFSAAFPIPPALERALDSALMDPPGSPPASDAGQ